VEIELRLEEKIKNEMYNIKSSRGELFSTIRGTFVMSEKLVRDKIAEYVFAKRGERLVTRTAKPEEMTQLLKQKVVEEANEVFATNNKGDLAEEIADLLEVLKSLAERENIVEEIFKKREAKLLERGGFDQGIVLMGTCKK